MSCKIVSMIRLILAVNVCVLSAILLALIGLERWNAGIATDNAGATATTSSLHKAGGSGQRLRMQPWRDAPSLSVVMDETEESIRILPSAPLKGPDGKRFPVCDVWAVITTVNPPSKLVHQLTNITGLCMCIVADEKGASVYDVLGKDLVYLTPEMQRSLPYNTIGSLPWNHFGRKNLGYLFAMHHGARIIYDTDDDNELLMDVLNNPEARLPHLTFSKTDRFFRSSSSGSSNQTTRAFNPYPAFGAPQAWPRGLPFEEIRLSSVMTCNSSTALLHGADIVEERLVIDVGIIQSLANYDPDVDAIYRSSSLPLPFSFNDDRNAQLPIALGHEDKLMSPYNAQATLHFHTAFWAMLLPISVHGRVSDIWRGYFAQRLFWETGLAVAFSAPWVAQVRNPQNYLADFEAESDLYGRAGELLHYLTSEWICPEDKGLDACMMALYLEMYRTGIVEHADVQLAAAWLTDLKAIGYTSPRRFHGSRDSNSPTSTVKPSDVRTESFDVADFSVPGTPPEARGVVRLKIPLTSTVMNLPSRLTCQKAWASVYDDANFTRPRGVGAANITINKDSIVTDIQITHGAQTDDPLFIKLNCLPETSGEIADTGPAPQNGAGTLITFRLLEPVAILPVFKDILLITNFNHGQDYHMLPDLLASYGEAFPNHMFIGSDQPDPALDKSITDQIHVIPEVKNGWSMPIAMKHAMEEYPDVKGGYMLVNNDVAMRPWKWHHHDWTRVGAT